jgi:hypothetical protein
MPEIIKMLVFSFPPCGACSIDCTSYYELESEEFQKRGMQLSPELWLVKLMVRIASMVSILTMP